MKRQMLLNGGGLGEADMFWGKKDRVLRIGVIYPDLSVGILIANVEKDRIRWIAGIAMAGAWRVVELRNWMGKVVYRLIFLKNHRVWQILHRFLNGPELPLPLLPEKGREASRIRLPITSEFSHFFPHFRQNMM
jgi:hypothetical protein